MSVNGVYKINGDPSHNTVPLQEISVRHDHPHPHTKGHAPLERQDSAFGIVTPMTLSFQHIDVYSKPPKKKLPFVKKSGATKHILKDVCGEVKPGQLLAIMGASGAGKTTLLNVLTGRSSDKLKITGNILVNEKKVGRTIVRLSAYVQQQDLFMGTLTVKEHLTFQALLRMDKECDHKTRMERVEQALIELGLTKCAKTKIGIPGRVKGISGGEMKRLTFASEILTNPCLMFCDEPTSGLDAYMAQTVVAVLKKMANEGRTIICTIHQPASDTYSMFDQILLMAEGRVAYMGRRQDGLDFLASVNINCPPNYNPADYFIDQLAVVPGKEEICRSRIQNVCDAFLKSVHSYNPPPLSELDLQFHGEEEEKHKRVYKTSVCTQLMVLLRRSFLIVLREKSLTAARLLQTIVLAVLLALIYRDQKYDQESIQNINGALFIILTNMTFQNIMTILAVFGQELNVFLREHTNGMYRPSIYFLSKTVAEAPIFILIPLFYVTIIYFAIGFNPSPTAFLICLGVSVLVSNVACSYAYMVASLFSNPALVAAFGYPLMFPLMLLGGFYLNHDTVPVYFDWMKYLSWFYYGNEALQVNQWKDITNLKCSLNETACLTTGMDVLRKNKFDINRMQVDIGMLAVLLVAFRVLAMFGLVLKVRSKN